MNNLPLEFVPEFEDVGAIVCNITVIRLKKTVKDWVS
jgi:hypothetical protein